MIITDQDEIMSIAKNRWRDNPQKGGFALDWDKFCFHNTTNFRKILIRTESDISLSDAVDKLFKEIKSLAKVEPRTVICSLSDPEKTPSLTMEQLLECRQSLSELIPEDTNLLFENLWSDKIEAVALLFIE